MGGVDELEDEYQRKKALSTGITDEATITNTFFSGTNEVGQQAILRLETTAGESHLVGIDLYDPETREDLITVYDHAGLSLENDPADLVGESIEISYKHIEKSYRDDKTMVILHCNSQKIETDWDFDLDNYRMNKMPTEIKKSFFRAYRYVNSDNLAMSQIVESISSDNECVYIDFAESNDRIKMSKNTTYTEDPQSSYERLIEYVGEGSVETIVDSRVYITHISTVYFGDHNDDMTSRKKKKKVQKSWEKIITIENTPTGVWIVSGVEPPSVGNIRKNQILAVISLFLVLIGVISQSAISFILGLGFFFAIGLFTEIPGLKS